ncbi:DUF2812 domain-containing protein [Bacillus sp. REN16]|uniref:DUF2812 domain-containing protein n=1 Tax=Bacillus sp. REN16 TaxID=2887296 RepID=UPI001E4889C8|nr:DUF2812 domain-containing protein [Bacillus sp. REN16]MCC3357037.1 DUF2812 domain-containing protein [Bacillus sp. REN16]
MSKIVRKIRPSDYWRIGEHESWFQDMAAEGLHFKKMGKFFAHFVKAEPKKMRYRIEISMKRKMKPEQIEMYEESGWDYVTKYQYFQVFSSPEERDAPEIHTDPAEQSYTLKELDKKLVSNAVFVVFAMLLIIGLMSSVWFLDGTPTYILIEGLVITQTILSLIIGYQAYNSLLAAISIRALRKNLIEGKPIDHHAPWKRHHRLNSVIALIFMIVSGLTTIVPITQLVKMDTKTLPEGSLNLPIVRLADVEQNPALVRGESEFIDNVDWGNSYSTNWSPFAPVQYESSENGLVPGELWADGSGEYSPSIETKFYQLSFPYMTDNLISDLIKRYNFDNESMEAYVETKNPHFDSLIVHVDEEFKEVFASKGKDVIYVRYYGYKDMNSVVKAIEEKLN